MPRKKITSTTAKKAKQKLNRAVKRGDGEPLPENPRDNRHPKRFRRTKKPQQPSDPTVDSARRLQSSFARLPPKFLEITKLLAASLVLPRPLSSDSAIYREDRSSSEADTTTPNLSCPRRPKWNFEMSKKEVEANEEGVFKKWLQETDKVVAEWQTDGTPPPAESSDDQEAVESAQGMPRSTTYFERNIEVWRQLWRVTEISHILLVLLDSRCPSLHYPPSLEAFLRTKKVIIVLTKTDISGPARTEAWISYFEKQLPNVPVVQVQSFVEKDHGASHQGKKMYEPHMPRGFRERLVDVIKTMHADLLQPPEAVRQSEKRMNEWIPPVKKDIDWDAVKAASGDKAGTLVGGATQPLSQDSTLPSDADAERTGTHDFTTSEILTIGLIGQPNVGKSSLLNALFGSQKVRASRTPGKTKHFQTLFWTSEVRLVDCPGLVMPNFVPLEMQILAGTFPISRVSAIPSSIYHAACLLPLEEVLHLKHPDADAPMVEDKRTWRDSMKKDSEKTKAKEWTAMHILTAYANNKSWITAKAGRPDINRAGNALLRLLAEGRIPWAFWPPEADPSKFEAGKGVWITDREVQDDDDKTEDEATDKDDKSTDEDSGSSEEEGSESEDESDSEVVGVKTAGRFNILQGGNLDEDDDEDDDE